MGLLGKAVVAIWNDIVPEGRENFIEWHNREHIPERVAIPGFLRGRRYVSDRSSPEYFTLYEAADAAVLVGPAYLERLNNPTPWTRKSTADFRNTIRGVCQTEYSHGSGDGGHLLTLRFDADEDRRVELLDMIGGQLGTVASSNGVVGVHLCVADTSASGIKTSESKGRDVGVPNWIVMVETSTIPALEHAADILRSALVERGQIEPVEFGSYRLEFSLLDFSERLV